MKRRLALALCTLSVALCLPASAAAAPFTFTILPPGGAVSGAPGTWVGWGYEITNPSGTDWLEVTSLAAPLWPSPPVAGDNLLFDFPIVAPGATVTVSYLPAVQGLYEILWDPGASPGTLTGLFIVGGQFWTADPTDPFSGAAPLGPADDQDDSFSASVTGVPEPGTLMLLAAGAVLLAARRR